MHFWYWKQDIYGLGARRIGVTSLPPLGCFPAALTLFGNHQNGCVSRINTDAQAFNKKLNSAAESLKKQLPGFRIVIFDIYKPLYDVISSPSKNGKDWSLFFLGEKLCMLSDIEWSTRNMQNGSLIVIFFCLFLLVRLCGSQKRLLWNRDSGDNITFVQSQVLGWNLL